MRDYPKDTSLRGISNGVEVIDWEAFQQFEFEVDIYNYEMEGR